MRDLRVASVETHAMEKTLMQFVKLRHKVGTSEEYAAKEGRDISMG